MASIVLILMCFAMFFLVYLLLLGGSDFHERDCIGYMFNKLMGGIGMPRAPFSKIQRFEFECASSWQTFSAVNASTLAWRDVLELLVVVGFREFKTMSVIKKIRFYLVFIFAL